MGKLRKHSSNKSLNDIRTKSDGNNLSSDNSRITNSDKNLSKTLPNEEEEILAAYRNLRQSFAGSSVSSSSQTLDEDKKESEITQSFRTDPSSEPETKKPKSSCAHSVHSHSEAHSEHSEKPKTKVKITLGTKYSDFKL